MKICIVDNYDSFTYNLVHYLEEITGEKPFVCMNDQIEWAQLDMCSHIVLSPGPGLPITSGELLKVIEKYHDKKKMLGVCLGMQAIALYFGGTLKNLEEVKHGVQNNIRIIGNNILFKDLPKEMEVGRYHSWTVEEKGLPSCLSITSLDEEGNMMSMCHTSLPLNAVQFHPESIMTIYGKKILRNWLEI